VKRVNPPPHGASFQDAVRLSEKMGGECYGVRRRLVAWRRERSVFSAPRPRNGNAQAETVSFYNSWAPAAKEIAALWHGELVLAIEQGVKLKRALASAVARTT
jgi:hypothetical protein